MNLIALGTNGYIPSYGRHTMSFLVLGESDALVLDAGTGMSRLLEPAIRERLNGYDRLSILLSHYHLDHVVGLSFLLGVWPDHPTTIYGPSRPLVDADPIDAVNGLYRPPFFSIGLADLDAPVEIVSVSDSEFTVGEFHIRARRQPHPGGSIGIRIGDDLAYVTDTAIQDETVDFVRGVKALLHEVWMTDEEAAAETPDASRHSHESGVADIAREAGVEWLAPIHHHPSRTPDDLLAAAERMQARAGVTVRILAEGETSSIR